MSMLCIVRVGPMKQFIILINMLIQFIEIVLDTFKDGKLYHWLYLISLQQPFSLKPL